jgi:hypothetical protein
MTFMRGTVVLLTDKSSMYMLTTLEIDRKEND